MCRLVRLNIFLCNHLISPFDSGNPLGTRYVPCKSASDGFLSSRNMDKRSSSSRLRGSQYWQASGSQAQDFTVYSFFSHSVTPTPAYAFPAQKSRQRVYSEPHFSDASLDLVSSAPSLEHPTELVSDDDEDETLMNVGQWQSVLTPRGEEETSLEQPPTNMILDRFAASSPTPLSEYAGDETPQPYGRVSSSRYHSLPAYPPENASTTYAPPVSFYQQQVIGAWERERESDREDDRRRPSRARGFDPDGESVWGFVDPDGAPSDVEEPDSPDKMTERFLFPER